MASRVSPADLHALKAAYPVHGFEPVRLVLRQLDGVIGDFGRQLVPLPWREVGPRVLKGPALHAAHDQEAPLPGLVDPVVMDPRDGDVGLLFPDEPYRRGLGRFPGRPRRDLAYRFGPDVPGRDLPIRRVVKEPAGRRVPGRRLFRRDGRRARTEAVRVTAVCPRRHGVRWDLPTQSLAKHLGTHGPTAGPNQSYRRSDRRLHRASWTLIAGSSGPGTVI